MRAMLITGVLLFYSKESLIAIILSRTWRGTAAPGISQVAL